MRHILMLFAVCLMFTSKLGADPAQTAQAQNVIRSQIDAFRSADFDAAFAYASPEIQRIFRTPESFEAMVRGGYGMVLNPARMHFGQTELRGGAIVQSLIVQDATGLGHELEYLMQRIDGDWRIAGVRLIERSAPSV